MNFLGFGQSAEIDIVFDGADNRKYAEIKTEDGKKEKYLLYYDGETVSGKVNITLKKPGSKLEHQGIKIELIGQIELFYDRGNHHEFTSLVKELARPGDLLQNYSYPFEFLNVEKPYEVYVGCNVRLRYFLRVTIVRRLSDIVKEVDIAVHTLCSYPDLNSPIKMEVGIEDCLHIEFEYNKSKYHLKDVIVGKIYFLLVRIKIKHMEIAIIKRETTGSGPNTFTENETIAKYEIMDGAPVKGESIPIRVFLAGYDLTPTMRDINKKFSVKYFLNLVLMDTEDRRYFKQQEITLWRKADKSRKTQSQAVSNPHVPTHLVGGPDNNMSAIHSTSGKNEISGIGGSGKVTPYSNENNTSVANVSSDNEQNQTTDPKMGLFTRESPDQESKSSLLQQSSSSSSTASDKTNQKQPIIPNALPLPINNDDGAMQRGTADGASAQAENNSEENNGDSTLLFNSAPNSVTKLNQQQANKSPLSAQETVAAAATTTTALSTTTTTTTITGTVDNTSSNIQNNEELLSSSTSSTTTSDSSRGRKQVHATSTATSHLSPTTE